MWGTTAYPGPYEGGCASQIGMFSAVEFGCGTVDVVGNMCFWFEPTATENASISTIKALY